MNQSSISLLDFSVFQSHPELIDRLSLVVQEIFHGSIVEAKDYSIGTDQSVIYIKTTSRVEAIVKIPKSSFRNYNDSSFFPMHLPNKQAWLLGILKKHDVLGPSLIYLDPDNKFFIESFIPEANYSEKENEFSDADKKNIMHELGKTMKKFHEIKSNKFGYMILGAENEGKFESWFDLFREVPESIKNCCALRGFGLDIQNKLEKIFEEQKEYLKTFKEPSLLHADISFNNMRVQKIKGQWHFSGLIDFADLLSGDPLFDFGEFFGSCGDWNLISHMENGYLDGEKFTMIQMKAIRFYAVYFCLWWLEVTEDPKKIERITKTFIELLYWKI